MARVLVVYATSEGHTKKISERLAGWIRESGHRPTLFDSSVSDFELELAAFDCFILAGSIHQGKHQASLADFARSHRIELNSKATAFLSVSLSAIVKDEKHLADCQKCIDGFTAETGLRPQRSIPVAGALLYTQYDFLTKQFMRMICAKEGGDTDTTRDFEYTDWEALRSFVDGFLRVPKTVSHSAEATISV